jgi:hypothetical protein
MKNLAYAICLLSLFALSACVEEIRIDPAAAANFVVVDGVLNFSNTADSQDLVVHLSYSRSNFARPAPLGKAVVSIVVNGKDIYPLSEGETGAYYVTNRSLFKVGSSYQLKFSVGTETYESSLEVMQDSVPMRGTYGEVNVGARPEQAFEVFVDMVDAPQQKNFYRWALTLWEAQTFCTFCYKQTRAADLCIEDLYGRPEEIITRNPPCASACYDIVRQTPNNAISDIFFDGKTLIKKFVGYVPLNFTFPCLVEVKQSSLTPQYFAFLEILKSQAESTGGLADTPAALLVGNVKNTKNPTEKVVGYFSVTNNSVKRFFLDRAAAVNLGMRPLSQVNPPLDAPTPVPAIWFPIPCNKSRYRTPVKPWGWQ